MREKLYLTISKFSIRSLFYDYFMFFDTTPYLADQLFIRHEVRVWFDSEYAKEGSPYLAIFCHVRKKDVPKFLAALEDLKKSMMLCGHPNYEAEISRFMDNVEKMKGVVLDNENDAAQKAEQKRTAYILLIQARLLERGLAYNPYCTKQEGL